MTRPFKSATAEGSDVPVSGVTCTIALLPATLETLSIFPLINVL